jgi:hypothetical protein
MLQEVEEKWQCTHGEAIMLVMSKVVSWQTSSLIVVHTMTILER